VAHHPDVVVTDIEMPEMTGLELANELKRRSSGTAVIILTTFARSDSCDCGGQKANRSGYIFRRIDLDA
jgi:DNA-binding NarL/FixJ family response regulator